MTEKDTKESGLQRHIGIKKYGKKGFEELQQAGREGASEEEKGAIKDKHLPKKKVAEFTKQAAPAPKPYKLGADKFCKPGFVLDRKTRMCMPKAPRGMSQDQFNNQNESIVREGLADLADRAERDHEVQMARSDLYKIAKYAIKLHEMLKGVSEEEGLEGWVQSKITKASDYIGSVYHYMDYDEKFDAVPETAKPKRNKPILSDAEIKSYKGSLKEKLESIK